MACSAARFFDRFSTIFSTNYDLISYWIVMHERSCKSFPHSRSVSDGFGPPPKHYQGKARLVFKDEWHRHRICYLHGALHLFTDGRFTEKLAYFRGQSLLSQIEERIVQGSYPIFVTDAYARSKSLRIAGNGYLHAVSQQFATAGRHIFTYGWSVSDADEHLAASIVRNPNIKAISIGVYGDDPG